MRYTANIPALNADEWNALMDLIAKRLPIRGIATLRKWSHPWSISPEWSDEDGWLFRINPGFVNGLEPEVETLARLASSRTLSRIEATGQKLPKDKEPVIAYITETPRVRLGSLRLIGKGSNPEEVTTTADGAVNLRFEGVPKFFEQFGVMPEQVVFIGGLNSGLQELGQSTADKDPPILRAADVILSVDRFTARTDIYRGNGFLDSFSAAYATTYGRSAPIKDFPTLRTDSKFIPRAKIDLADINQELSDGETDDLKVATIYLLSPPDTSPTSIPDRTWRPFVAHDLFWNLAHGSARLPDPVEVEPARVITGLAAGLADSIFSGLLSPLNDNISAAAALLQAPNLNGRFWTV